MSHALFATVTAYFFNSVAIAESVGVNRINWRPSSALVPAPTRVYGPVSARRRARRSVDSFPSPPPQVWGGDEELRK